MKKAKSACCGADVLFGLQFFAEGGDGADGGDSGDSQGVNAASPAARNETETAGVNEAPPRQSREEQYRQFKEQFKSEYDAEVQGIIQDRLKKASNFKTKADRVFGVLSQKYGGDPNDIDSLLKSVEEDDSYYEEEATRKGISVEQLKQMKKLERENSEFRQAALARQQQQGAAEVYGKWVNQAENVKARYDSKFNLQNEINANPEFLRLIKAGVDVKTAYEVLHRDELNSKVMQITAEKTEQAVVNKIKANGLRPTENGLNTNAGTTPLNINPKNLTAEQRADIKKRVRAGEKIKF